LFRIHLYLPDTSSLTVVWFFYPETKSLSLEEIDLIFTGDIDAVAEAAGKIHEGALADEKEKGAVNAIEMENV
jgi:hypothetical protein